MTLRSSRPGLVAGIPAARAEQAKKKKAPEISGNLRKEGSVGSNARLVRGCGSTSLLLLFPERNLRGVEDKWTR
jgi:hypothetical protein